MTPTSKALLIVGLPLLIVGVTQVAGWDGGYFQLYYVGPLALLAPWFVLSRLSTRPSVGHRTFVVDLLVGVLACSRIFTPAFPASGHALFLVYSAATVSNRWYRIAALAVFVQSTWLKVAAWNETGSWVSGIVLGAVLAGVARWPSVVTTWRTRSAA